MAGHTPLVGAEAWPPLAGMAGECATEPGLGGGRMAGRFRAGSVGSALEEADQGGENGDYNHYT